MTNQEAIRILKEHKQFGIKVRELLGITSDVFEEEQEALEKAIKLLEWQEENNQYYTK